MTFKHLVGKSTLKEGITVHKNFESFFESYTLLLMPATPITAPEQHGADAVQRARQLTRFSAPFNLTGLPALSLPCGFNQEGLPIGLQIVAGPWREATLLRAGYAYEQATEWHKRKPDLTWSQIPGT